MEEKMKRILNSNYLGVILPLFILGIVYLKTYIHYRQNIIVKFDIPFYLIKITYNDCLLILGKSFIIIFLVYFLYLFSLKLSNMFKSVFWSYLILLSPIFIILLGVFLKNEILGNLSIGYTIAIYLNSFLENIKEEKFSKFIFFSLIIFILQPTYLQKKYSVLEEIGDKKEILVYFGDKYYVSKIYDTKLNELESNFNVVFFDDIKNGLKIKKYEILEITHKKIWE